MRVRRLLVNVFVLALMLLAGVPCWLTYREAEHEKRNRLLIEAVKKGDQNAVQAALDAGADANARDWPDDRRSFYSHLVDMVRGRHPAPSKFPTALLLAAKAKNVNPRTVQAL